MNVSLSLNLFNIVSISSWEYKCLISSFSLSNLGKVNVIYNNEVLYTFDVYLDKKIKYYNYVLYIIIGLSILVTFVVYKIRHKK